MDENQFIKLLIKNQYDSFGGIVGVTEIWYVKYNYNI